MRAAPDDRVPGQREQLAYTASLVIVFALREAGWRPVGVFAGATVVNLLVGLLLATLLFSGFPAA